MYIFSLLHKLIKILRLYRLEFLEAKIEWQDKMIKDLEGERNFLREQVLGLKKKSNQSKVPTLEEVVSMYEDDSSQSPAEISDSSESDVVIPKKKQRNTRNPASPDVAVPGRAHMRAEVVHRYKKVLKTFGRVRTMSEAFRINNVDRGTIKMTAPIAELKIVDPDTFESLKCDPTIDTLLSFAKKCATNVTADKKAHIEDMKAKGRLLPLLMKY
ncbi:Coiled-coil domain containing protein 106 [Dissostichus eleginoides]|uniref:Coiled-coil domain containing protein 106 n=1 Tax=Dissostichus eleginoides TaxID=100907 RepID=A0AAD9CR83_DISEL|nr:Coiled-coil domain containing protein 106 [Dissostichus eleginoides]